MWTIMAVDGRPYVSDRKHIYIYKHRKLEIAVHGGIEKLPVYFGPMKMDAN